MTSKIVTTREPLSFNQALSVLSYINVTFTPVEDHAFMSSVKRPTDDQKLVMEKIVEKIVKKNVESLANNLIRNDRQDRKAGRHGRPAKGSWDTIQRKGVLRGKLEYILNNQTLQELFDLYRSLEVAFEQIFPVGTRGPTPFYERQLLCIGVMVKFRRAIQWQQLPSLFRSAGFDFRTVEGRKRAKNPVPSHEVFHRVYRSCSQGELAQLLEETDDLVASALGEWLGDPVSKDFAVDGSGHPLQAEECLDINGECNFRRISVHAVLIQRIKTGTVRALCYPEQEGLPRPDVRHMLERLPRGSRVFADSEFDVEYLQETASACKIELHASPDQPKNTTPRTPHRRAAHAAFDKEAYRQRKRVESIFNTLTKRGIFTPRYTKTSTAVQASYWSCLAHNYACFERITAYQEIYHVVTVDLPEWPTIPAGAISDQDKQQTPEEPGQSGLTVEQPLELSDRVLHVLQGHHSPENGLSTSELVYRLEIPLRLFRKASWKLRRQKKLRMRKIKGKTGKIIKHSYFLPVSDSTEVEGQDCGGHGVNEGTDEENPGNVSSMQGPGSQAGLQVQPGPEHEETTSSSMEQAMSARTGTATSRSPRKKARKAVVVTGTTGKSRKPVTTRSSRKKVKTSKMPTNQDITGNILVNQPLKVLNTVDMSKLPLAMKLLIVTVLNVLISRYNQKKPLTTKMIQKYVSKRCSDVKSALSWLTSRGIVTCVENRRSSGRLLTMWWRLARPPPQ